MILVSHFLVNGEYTKIMGEKNIVPFPVTYRNSVGTFSVYSIFYESILTFSFLVKHCIIYFFMLFILYFYILTLYVSFFIFKTVYNIFSATSVLRSTFPSFLLFQYFSIFNIYEETVDQ